jgi:hypothetical protein
VLLALCCTLTVVASAQDQKLAPATSASPADDPNVIGPGYPRLDDAWTFSKSQKKKSGATLVKLAAAPPAAPEPQPTPTSAQPQTVAATPETTNQSPAASPIPKGSEKEYPNEVSLSGDFLYGQGHVTLPFFFSLHEYGVQQHNAFSNLNPFVTSAPRDSDYFGGATISYGRNKAMLGGFWFVDFSYAHGSSSGTAVIPETVVDPVQQTVFPATTTAFSIDDNWYQGFLRYEPKWFLTTPYYGYLRAGVSYVNATMTDYATFPPPVNSYKQTDHTSDLVGNLGFGFGYRLKRISERMNIILQIEGEGFYGHRNQKSEESLIAPAINAPAASIENDLYGGIARGTVRIEHKFGELGLFKVFADVGAEARYTIIEYTGLGTHNELLWGPYVKLGLRKDF